MDGRIIVVTHKNCAVPCNSTYFPVCVGPDKDSMKYKFQPDNVGVNISDKNVMYCELTALYWAWKNLEFDYLGLAHYRRYFGEKRSSNLSDVLTNKRIVVLLQQYDVIVPQTRIYYQTVSNHYINCIKSRKKAHKEHLRLLRETIKERSPQFLSAYDSIMNGHRAHMLNMFIMKKKDLDEYCEWLFHILFSLEPKIYEKNVYYDRIMGAFSEFLLDVWIRQKKKKVYETKLVETEKDFWKKMKWVLKRRFLE